MFVREGREGQLVAASTIMEPVRTVWTESALFVGTAEPEPDEVPERNSEVQKD